jgi:hypothetical protein
MKLSLALLALSAGLFSAAQAKADTLDTFALTGDGNTFTFSLTSPSSPAPCGFGICYSGISVVDNGHTQIDTVEFTGNDGIDIFNNHGQSILELSLNNHQPDFLKDSKGLVTFIGGTYALRGDDHGFGSWDYNGKVDCETSAKYSLVLDPPSTSPVPEPSSLAFMSTGLLAAAGAVRSRMKK